MRVRIPPPALTGGCMLEFFYWHTVRSWRYPDAYWQWLKVSHFNLEEILTEDENLYKTFNEIYTYGWQYDMGIISLVEFRSLLQTTAQNIGSSNLESQFRNKLQGLEVSRDKSY